MSSSITITGVAAKAPEKRYTESNLAIATFALIFDEENLKSIKCEAFGKLANILTDNVKAGTWLDVSGTLIREGDPPKPVIQVTGFQLIEGTASGQSVAAENADQMIGEDEIPF